VAIFKRDSDGKLEQLQGNRGCVSDAPSDCQDGKALDGPQSVSISRDGENVYVSSVNSDAVAVFERDEDTGELTQLASEEGCVSETGSPGGAALPGERCEDGKALDSPSSVAVSPDGDNVYTAARDSDAVARFERDPDTGALDFSDCVSETGTGGDCEDGKALDGATFVDVSPDGESVYVASVVSDAVAAFERDRDGGELDQLSDPDGCVSETGRSVAGDPETSGDCGEGRALDGAQYVTVSRGPPSVYVASFFSGGGALAFFRRGADGSLGGDEDDGNGNGNGNGKGNGKGNNDNDNDGDGPVGPVFSAEAFAFAQCLSLDLAGNFRGVANLGRLGRCMAATVNVLTSAATPGEACRRQRLSGVRGAKRRSDFSACFLAASRAVLARRLAGF